MNINYATKTDSGSREVNEDTVLAAEYREGVIAILGDGLGGHGMGDIASQLAVEEAAKSLASGGSLADAFNMAQDCVMKAQERLSAGNKMKTTLCVLRVCGEKAEIGHIGDSRIYCFQNGRFAFRTKDHSIPQMLVNSGEIKEEDIRFHEERNRLLRVIGTEWDGPQYELEPVMVLKRHRLFGRKNKYAFLLCSDGWWELVNEQEMADTLSSSGTPEEWLKKMSCAIWKNGSGKEKDNNTAAAIFVNYDR